MDLNFVNVMAANFFETKNDVFFLIFRPGPRDATLDFENGEFICPMCRQVANALLPVPPDAPPYPLSHSFESQSSSSKIRQIALNIHDLLGQETLQMSDGPTPLKSEMSKIVQVLRKRNYFLRTEVRGDFNIHGTKYF